MFKLFLVSFLFAELQAQEPEYDFVLPEGKVVVFGDSRRLDPAERAIGLENTDAIRPEIFRSIAEERPVAVFHTGDIASFGFSKREWSVFEKEAKPIRDAGVPFFPVLGNHDLKGPNSRALKNYFEAFPHLGDKRYYSVLVGTKLFLLFDTNFSQMSQRFFEAQLTWLESLLKRAQADPQVDFVFPLFHHPPYSNVNVRDASENRDVERYFVPLFRSHPKVRMAFCGHVHTYERIEEGGIQYVVTGGGGAPRFKIRMGRDKRRKDFYPEDVAIRDFHYLRLGASGDSQEKSVGVEMVRLKNGSWTLGESFSIKRIVDKVFDKK